METKPNLLLITIDCGRQDMVYGDEVETPHIDRIRGKGITFLNAYSQSSTTIPSLYSLFTSRYLSSHGVTNQHPAKYKRLSEDSLPAILWEKGWKVNTFLGFDILKRIMGRDINPKRMGRGEEPLSKRVLWGRRIKNILKRKANYFLPFTPLALQARVVRRRNIHSKIMANVLVDQMLGWLSNLRNEKFFAWVHFFDAHQFYSAPPHWVDRYYKKKGSSCQKSVYHQLKEMGFWFPFSYDPIYKMEQDIDLYPSYYRAALSYIDQEIGRVLKWLEENQKMEDTLIIITSDHGENLLENGIYCGHHKLFDETTKVPFILKDPLQPHGAEVSSLVQHIDLMPTLLERLSLSIPSQVQGKSLWPAIQNGEEVNQTVFSEHVRLYQKTVRTAEWQYLWANPETRHPWGLIFEGEVLLDRRKKDKTNYASLYPVICKEMEGMIQKLSNGFRPIEEREEAVSEEIIEKLKALGYIDG